MYDDLRNQITQQQSRWLLFIDKLTARAKELYEPARAELTALRKSDNDPYKTLTNKVLSGVCGQLGSIRKKAYDAHEKEIIDFYYCLKDEIAMTHPLFDTLYAFRTICLERFGELEKMLLYMEQSLREDAEADLEDEYNKIIDDFNKTKENLRCSQCGHSLPIDRVFFIAVHIACPACGAQNTLEPGSQARSLQFIANDLAAKRSKPLLEASQQAKDEERDLYAKAHSMKLDAIHKDDKAKAAVKKEIELIDAERERLIARSRELYDKYLRAVCDEMNKIIPDFKDHHEKVYLKQINQI
ncbi:MAG: hypothetical protein LBC09_00125 [Helicobacteraceae bacterium]|jgi:predicted RNA-binding Zn-ribbon protein involved in translation (DUF1610 family)|nr:hypothetical protein [Helicobacteraceae bacterium]